MTENLPKLEGEKCAVIGAGGFLGANLCKRLLEEGCVVHAFGRRTGVLESLRSSRLDVIPGDYTEPASVSAALSGVSYVFHLATSSTPAGSNVDKSDDITRNLAPSVKLLDLCRDAGVKRVIFASSGGTVYGIPKVVPTNEEAPLRPITAYGINKACFESYLHLYRHLYGLDYRVLRIANPYGYYQTAVKNQGVVARFALNAIQGRPLELWGDGSVIRDYIFVDDVVQAFVTSATHESKDRVFNIGSGKGRSLNEVIEILERTLGEPVEVRRYAGRHVDVPRSVLDITRARNQLGWSPTVQFEEGVSRTLDWLMEEFGCDRNV